MLEHVRTSYTPRTST